jgi:hypothetical protein
MPPVRTNRSVEGSGAALARGSFNEMSSKAKSLPTSAVLVSKTLMVNELAVPEFHVVENCCQAAVVEGATGRREGRDRLLASKDEKWAWGTLDCTIGLSHKGLDGHPVVDEGD